MTTVGQPPEPVVDERSLEPGAMEVVLSRALPSGHLVEFESAPAGWLAKDGKPRVNDWRRYYFTAAADAKRSVFPSVTTICGDVLPKPGLQRWYEENGIKGARLAVERGIVTVQQAPAEWVGAVRGAHLGAEAARDEAADRGLNVHAILEAYALSATAPNPSEHPESHRPFIRGLVKWLLWADPEPVAVEVLVADPERGYAGRADLIARIGKRLVLVDLKTNPKGAIFDSAHLQVELLRQAEERYGEHPIEHQLLVSVDQTGGFREMECVAGPELASRALAFYSEVKHLAKSCGEANKIHRMALEASA